ncbi:PrgI family protein [Verrucosispora sp. CWR15]|uniref:PrgI family protein n=1 Tax=Verrucosispora sioxanthis TaxID=2499994 RepID=A0A6M1L7M8_9ACTN|nr:PrgI family protein [Verrucosispora sioxanthis]NEE65138.1 PrgI family protein [Verrucosispora sioxanthis]NGM14248.1 PrgI family protein [Verrucosispora sioxanthis]
MSRRSEEAPLRARVPADIERADRIAFGMSGRQLVILAVAGLLLYAAWTAVATLVHPVVFLAGAMPVAAGAFLLAVGRRDGISLDAWVLAALRHRRSPRRLVPADGPVIPAPAWVQTAAGPGDRLPLPAPLRLPAKGITVDGLIDLGSDGTTGLVAASTVAFGLRTSGEQNALVAGFARWLHSLDGPAQIVVRAQRVDLTYLADRFLAAAPGLPHSALEEAANAHVAFLDDLAARRELLHRQITVAVRSRRGAHHTAHTAAETVRALAGCEVPARLLDGPDAAVRLAASLDPAAPALTPYSTSDRGDDL